MRRTNLRTHLVSLLVASGCAATSARVSPPNALCGVEADGARVCRSELDGTITPDDLVLQQDNSNYDLYEVGLEAGDALELTMTSEAFDTYLLVVDSNGERAAFNDDDASLGGNGTNSRLTYVAARRGRYAIYANSYQAGESGPYHLVVTTRDAR